MADIPHLALPFRFENYGRGPKAVVTEQDSYAEIFDCVQAIVRYPRGFRIDLPSFGITDPTFTEPSVELMLMEREIAQWESRAQEAISQERDRFDALIERVRIEVRANEETNIA